MDAMFQSNPRALDRSRHAAPQVFEILRDRIISLELKPGTMLSRVELQNQFGVSSTPIRDALLRLQEEGLVDIYPQHATVVSPIDLGLARQAQFLRRSIEQEIARTLAQARDDGLVRRLRAIIEEQKRFARMKDLDRMTAADEQFHRAMYEAAGIPDLWNLVRRNSGHIDRLRRLHLPVEGKAKQIVQDHLDLVEAIATGDPDLAQQRVREHLSKSLAFSTEMRARFPEFFRG